MWQCPQCKRSFRNTHQDHYCGKIETVDQYIGEQSEDVQPILQQIRGVIRTAAPNATEKMSWQMPTFWQGENLIHFAAFQKHISIFPGGEASSKFADKLTGYKTAKGTIQFPMNEPIPYELIDEITRWRVMSVEEKQKPNPKLYEFTAVIQAADPDKDTAYIIFPYDIKTEFGKGRVKVHATFDGVPYDGSVVNMGVLQDDGSICYILGIRKDIRAKIGKQIGDAVDITLRERGG